MTQAEAPLREDEAEPEIVHWYPPRHHTPEISGARAFAAVALGAVAFGAVALGAVAIGRLAIGKLALGRMDMGSARFKDVQIDTLTVKVLKVLER
jgi:hypothetical protein